ncbi:hypothetical protein [Clostridium aciditolerans]|uniref:Lipoprotein n=1 Tax=Clostridium aciditolerans TaxID=339861 RepID=A0A934M8Z5_9CLOT|nr:hypothetical protein [Clostridium aciditolerans]MBI6875341.1 hypothetical protein [Clostridium aciditolerans]
MKKQIFSLFLICIVLLIGCSKEETFENFFHTTMGKMHKGSKYYSYSLIHKEMNVVHENDAIAIFVENDQQEEKIFIAYFEKEKDKWNWRHTRGAQWDSPIKWSSMNQVPYIYSGAINDKSISEVYAGEKPAKIIEVKGDKRFWYAVSDVKDVQVKAIKSDGTQEIIEETDENWYKVDY